MEIVIAFAVGILVGIFLVRRRPVGNLRVDRSDPAENPYLFLELSTDVSYILSKKHVTLRVRAEDFIPHE